MVSLEDSSLGKAYLSNGWLSAQQACQGSILIQARQEQILQARHPMFKQLRCAPHYIRPEICSSPVADETLYQTPPKTGILQHARYQSEGACPATMKHHQLLAIAQLRNVYTVSHLTALQ